MICEYLILHHGSIEIERPLTTINMKTKSFSLYLKTVVLLGLLFPFSVVNGQTTIASWTYDAVQGTINNPTPNIGTGTSSVVNLGTPTTSSGAPSAGCGGSTSSNLGWQNPNFNPGSSNEVNGVQYNAGTTGYTNIIFSWDQRFSKTSPNTVRLQYTTDGTTWTNFIMTGTNTTICAGTINANGCFETNTGDSFRRIRVDLSSITAANINANFGIRLLASQYQSTGQYRQSTTPTTVATTTGTWRFDNVNFLGTPITSGAVLSGSATICPFASTNINVTITGGVAPYTITYTDGTSNFIVNNYISGSNILVTPSATTTYTLVSVLDNSDTAMSPASGSAVVTVNAGVSPTFISSAGTTTCSGSNVTYTTQAGNDNYVWTFLNGATTAVLGTEYNIISGSTTTETVTIQWLLASGTATFSATVTYNSCSGTSATSSTTVYAFNAGAINTAGQTICSGGTPSLISSTTNASGGNGGITYQWQANGTTISGANSATYNPPSGLTTTTTYTRWVNDAVCNTTPTQSTGSWTVTVYSVFSAGAINTTGQTICSGGTPNIIGSATAASGGDGSITYQWQANGTPIAGATSATYTPPAGLSVTTAYTRWVKDGTCNTSYVQSTGSWTVTVNPIPTVTFTTQPGSSFCTGTSVTYITQPGQTNYTWVISGTSGTNYNTISGGTSTDNTLVIKWLNTSSGNTVSVNYTNSSLCTATSPTTSTATTTQNALPVVTFTTSPAATICSSTSATYTTQAGRSNYIWVVPGVAGTDYTITAGGISTSDYTVTLTWLTSGSKTVTVNYNSVAGCTAVTPASNTTSVTLVSSVVALSPSTQTTCQGTAFSSLAVITSGPTPTTYQWYSNTTATNSGGTPVPTPAGGHSQNFIPPSSSAGTIYYYIKVTGCSVVTSSSTGAYLVNPNPTITSTLALSSLCISTSPQSATLNYTATTSSPTSYKIIWNAAALAAGFTNIGSVPFTFNSGAGSITGITIPANLSPNQYTGTFTVSNATCTSSAYTVTINVGKQWNGATSTDWGTASNWIPSGVPTSSDCVVIPNGTTNSPVIAANAFANNLTINSTASLIVNTGIALEVQDFVKTDGNLTMNNNSSLVQINNVTNSGSGNMIYKRDVTSLHGYDYVYWSSPVASQPINNLYSTPTLGYKYYWDTLVDNGNGTGGNISQGNWALASGNMSIGKGYIIRGSTSYGWAGNLTSTFTGIPNNGSIAVPIARGSYQGVIPYIGINGVPIAKTDDNMNLIGNPYPSAINAIDFLNANSNIDGYVYLWTHNTSPTSTTNPFYSAFSSNYFTSDYITYNSSGSSSGPATFNGYIAAGQGFFVSMVDGSQDTSQSVSFTNSMRSKGYSNSQFYKSNQVALSSTENNKNRIWIDLIDSNNIPSRTLVGYFDGATNLKDRNFDAFTKVANTNLLYSLIGDESQVIQGRALPFDENDQVPLGYHAQSAGSFTIAIAAVDGLFGQGQAIYLEDKLLNVIYDLRQAPYVFSSDQGTFNNRFALLYTNTFLSNTNFSSQNASFVLFKSGDSINIKSDKTEISEIVVYDMQGRVLNDYKNVNASEFQFTAPRQQQIVVLKIITTDNYSFYKKFLN